MRKFLVTAGYLGLSPVAPGTCGTLLALAIYLLGMQTPRGELINAICLVLFFALSVAMCPWAEAYYAKKDPSPFVIDEVAGFFAAVALLGPHNVPMKAAAAFCAFRFFDIVKPFPARRLEALPRGWGIVLDDIVAGLYANLAVRAGLCLLGFS